MSPIQSQSVSRKPEISRRSFIQTTAACSAALSVPTIVSAKAVSGPSLNDRPVLGCIGTGSRWGGVGPAALQFSDCVAVCDVDANHKEGAAKRVNEIQKKSPQQFADYRKVLDRKDVDVVTIVTPDHWHTKIAIDAMRAGKDVYCEKPLTLTIDEGKQIIEVLKETGRVFQVGTQQRSEMGQRFLQAVALVRDGRIGDVKTVHVAIGGAPKCGPLPVTPVPTGLDWDMWLGQAPQVDYRSKDKNTRCHYEFRWWYEYSGGKMTDWGAHHVDIAQWAIDQNGDGQGPTSIEPIFAEHPTSMVGGMPAESDRYNTATRFKIKVQFAGGVTMFIRDECNDLGFGNGILFEGTKGRFVVNRGKIAGKPVEELADNPLSDELMQEVFKGRKPGESNAHMRNFFDCVADRGEPISDVPSHHRAMTTCHLANIAIRLNRTLEWDPSKELITNDPLAQSWQSRKQRKGFEIT